MAYNIGGGARVTVKECLDILVRLVGEGVVRMEGRQDGDVTHTYADTSLAQTELAFTPRVPLALGLERQVAWQRELAERATARGVC
jgi:UDP-glucuronate 4-epimerase